MDKIEEPSTQRPEVPTHLFGISLITFAQKIQKKLASVSSKTWAIFLMFGVFFALRLYHLGYHDFWYDEVHTVFFAQKSSIASWNPPMHLTLLHFWVNLFGPSEFSVRFPSLLFSFFSVILIFLLGRELFNRKVAVLASLFMGLSPLHLWYAQEARDYSMVLFMGTASSYFFLKAVKNGVIIPWIFFALTAVGGLYTNYFYMFLFFAQMLLLICLRRSNIRFKEALFFLAVLVLFLPWLNNFFNKFFIVWKGFWVLKPQTASLLTTFENAILGYNGTRSLYDVSNIFSAVLFWGALIRISKASDKKALVFCGILFFVPVMMIYFLSRAWFSIYLDRGLLLFTPYGYLLLASGSLSFSRFFRLFICGGLISVQLLGGYYFISDFMVAPIEHHLGTYIKKPVRPIAQYLKENINFREEILAFTNDSSRYGVVYYGNLIPKRYYFPHYYFFDAELTDTTWKKPVMEGRWHVPTNRILRLKFRKVWVIASDWARSGGLDENSKRVKSWLDNNLRLDLAKELDGVWIYRYVRQDL